MHFLTTSSVATERDADFLGLSGLDAWRAARTNVQMATKVAQYIAAKLPSESSLRQFLATAETTDIQDQLLARFHWLTEQPDIDVVQSSVEDRLSSMLVAQGRPANLARTVRVHLEARFWEVVTQKRSDLRRLTLGDLHRQVERATHITVPVRLEQLSELLGNSTSAASGLLHLVVESIPTPPSPLLSRPALTERLSTAVEQRKAVLLTGTVYKGKTTLAQLVALARCPDAWWLSLSERRPEQVDSILRLLANAIDTGACPGLVVIDDLDISPTAHRVFGRSLALVVHRSGSSGRGVLLTARGTTSESAQLSQLGAVEAVEVPELTVEEVEALCLEHGCPSSASGPWSYAVFMASRGHPKLVQVRLRELSDSGWPTPGLSDFTASSSATQTVKQLARQLLASSVSGEVATLLYTAAESSVLLHRSVLLRLAEHLGVANPGDAIDAATGRWLESIEQHWYRTTPLLSGAAGRVWSQERWQLAHLQLHTAILSKQTLDPAEAAALLYHGYFGRDWGRVARDALRLQKLGDDRASAEVDRHLLWLPYVALEPGQLIAGSAQTGAPLRGLQFRVAVAQDSESIPRVVARWSEEVRGVPNDELRALLESHMWNALVLAKSSKVPLRSRLVAIDGLTTLTGELATISAAGTQHFLERSAVAAEIPLSADTAQLFLALSVQWFKGFEALSVLADWLEAEASEKSRKAFDSVLDWPLVQTMGAFVQGAWSAVHEETTDWQPWLGLFERLSRYAATYGSLRLGSEVAKAQAIILTEYLESSAEALAVLTRAEEAFGKAPVLDEQRANVLFQLKDDEAVLKIWADLAPQSAARSVLDPFAFRRAGISAARLGRFSNSASILRAGAASIEQQSFSLTRFGLLVDCSLAEVLSGDVGNSARTFALAVLSLPEEAATEGHDRWDPALRAASDVCHCIENKLWRPEAFQPKFDVGYASSPALKVEQPQPGQQGRALLLKAKAAHLASTHNVRLDDLHVQIEALAESRYRIVRWIAAEANLSWHLGQARFETLLEAFVLFDKATAAVSGVRWGQAIVFPDETPDPDYSPKLESWFGLFVAACWLCNEALEEALSAWKHKLQTTSANGWRLMIESLALGFELPGTEAYEAAMNPALTPAFRCGAAFRSMRQPLSLGETLRAQGLLVSALVSDGSSTRQELFNLHIAKRVAKSWDALAESPFRFQSPRTTVPLLRDAIARVNDGRGTLRDMLLAAHRATNSPVLDFVSRLQ